MPLSFSPCEQEQGRVKSGRVREQIPTSHHFCAAFSYSFSVCLYMTPPPSSPHPSWPILSPETSRSCCFQASSGEDRRDTADPVTVNTQRSQLALMSFVGLLFWICCHVSHAITLAGLRVSVFIILTTKTGRAFLTQRGFHTSERAPFCLRRCKSVDSNCVCDSV